MRLPSAHVQLAALPLIALDLETTGLAPARDRVVQVAAVALLGGQILDQPRMERLVDPAVPIPETASRIHGLRDVDVAGKPRFAAIAAELGTLLASRAIVGHNVAFDLAFLRHEAARCGTAWSTPPALDVALLTGALEPSLRDLSLEAVADFHGVRIEGRHSATGDAMTAARIYACLVPRLRAADVRTLGEAQVLACSRSDLIAKQAAAGWETAAIECADRQLLTTPRIDSYVFEHRLADIMSVPPVTISADASLRSAAQLMVAKRIGALLVGAPEAPPLGILTERDVLRACANAMVDLGAVTTGEVMSTPVESMLQDERAYRALGRMDRRHIRHLCVVDAAGMPVGVVSQRDLLQHRARAALALHDAIDAATTVPELAAAYGEVAPTAARLLAEGVTGVTIAGVVSNEARALVARAAQIAADCMRSTHGEAPAPWCLLVLGSAGRGESLLAADQDNALIHGGAGEPDWFAVFGALVSDLLDQAGMPRCKGGVMAANAQWRGNEHAWRARLDGWLGRARPEDLLHVDIFFDSVAVAGDASLARRLLDDAMSAAARAPAFLACLAQSVIALRPARGLFGGLRTENGRIDLKLSGLLPLVSMARTLALRVGSKALSTPDRLRAAADGSRLSSADLSALLEVHADLTEWILRGQLADLECGLRPSGRIAIKELGRDAVHRVQRHLRTLDGILEMLPRAISG